MEQYYALYAPTPEHRFVPGIPARDLSPAEVLQYGGIDVLKNAQCYELVLVEHEQIEPEEQDNGR